MRCNFFMSENINGFILCEETSSNVEFKVKGVDNKNGFIIAEGILQEGNEVNRNKRSYPTAELVKAINSPRTRELVESGNLKGEAGHPTDSSIVRQTKIDPTLEQVWYTKLWMDGDYVMGHFTGTSNELGRSFNEDLRRGQKPSFSLRAVGSLVNENGKMTVRNMQMITYDRVYFPSHSKAYTQKIITSEAVTPGMPKQDILVIDPHDYFFEKSLEIQNIIKQSNTVLAENTIVTKLTQAEIQNYIISESASVKLALDSFNMDYNSMKLQSDLRTVKMKTVFGETVYLDTDSAIQKEMINAVSNYF